MATYEEAIKEAFASCPSNVPILDTIQVSHPSIPGGDLWFVKANENMTLGLESQFAIGICGVDPGERGTEPSVPDNPGSPGTQPAEPGNEPLATDYFSEVDDSPPYFISLTPFDRYGSGTVYSNWLSSYNEWDSGTEDDPIYAFEYASAAYVYDHAEWASLVADNDSWNEANNLYQTYLSAVALHDAWVAQGVAKEAWEDCIAENTTSQLFTALAFDITLSSSGDNGVQDLSITCCDVERIFSDFIQDVAASGSQEKIEITYRPYLGNDLTKPQQDPPLKLYITDCRMDVHQFSARATFGDLVNRPYPNEYYTAKRFPGLSKR